jgi:hypothetical protein
MFVGVETLSNKHQLILMLKCYLLFVVRVKMLCELHKAHLHSCSLRYKDPKIHLNYFKILLKNPIL